ncbi:unnamed protein product [Effrenium voratum]|nr:unnamed protein product [Effrenium voratum]
MVALHAAADQQFKFERVQSHAMLRVAVILICPWLASAQSAQSACSAGLGLLQKSPRQKILQLPGTQYDWSPVDGGDGRACRGGSASDNSASYYRVVSGIQTLNDCQAECMNDAECGGVEFSPGRCEVWTRAGGIEATVALDNFQCWSYKPSLYLPVDGGIGRQCRGILEDEASYFLQPGVQALPACKGLCEAEPACKGIEYAVESEQCKVWTEGIGASIPADGHECYRLEFVYVNSSEPLSACRGAHANDNSASYFSVVNVLGLEECKQSCREEPACQGIEYSSARCEVWTRPGGIEAVKPLAGTMCLKYAGTTLTTTTATQATSAPVTTTSATSAPVTTTSTTSAPVTTTSTPGTTSVSRNCRGAYEQCGGKSWNGETCCIYGWECVFDNDFYSQCKPSSQPTTTKPLNCDAPGTPISKLYQQCGGVSWSGAKCCEDGTVCVYDNDYYSSCRKNTVTTTGLSSTETQTTQGSSSSTSNSATTSTTTTTTTTTATTTTTTTAIVVTTTATTSGSTAASTTTTANTVTGSTTAATTSSAASTSLSTATTTTTESVECRKRYAQCGGKTYTGATCCEDGWYCIYGGPYYSQCKTTTTTTSFTSASAEKRADAHFLLQATFGPTRANLQEISGKSYNVWMQEQMAVQPSLHRVFYRERVQPEASSGKQVLVENTVEEPASAQTWSGGACPSVARSFQNEEGCQLLPGCAPLQLRSVSLQLNTTVLERFYAAEQRYVFALVDLIPTSPPCGEASRWKLLDCSAGCAASNLESGDAASIAAALQAEASQGWLRTVVATCTSMTPGIVVQVGDEYFQHVHSSEYNVYDFTDWVAQHPGGADKIQQWTSKGYILKYPASHPMGRFDSTLARTYIWPNFVGVFNDIVDIRSLPQSLQTVRVGRAFGALDSFGTFAEICGSPGEVPNKAQHLYPFHLKDEALDLSFDVAYDSENVALSKASVWSQLALQAPDQLRQRMAWALAQIFVVAPDAATENHTEMFVHFYDIFVRHAFGNYRDILREVTYSPVMGDYLTYKRNRAFDSDGVYPDENYAREIMQLFSIGLWKLNPDGSRMETEGNTVPTYSNTDIMNFARVFTGFDEQAERSNIEHTEGKSNVIDPMRMRAEWHDVYPKPKLDGGYLGDGYPLCADVKNFLSQGAKFRFIGHSQSDTDFLVLSAESPLYQRLCGGEVCSHQLVVELDETLPCFGNECSAGFTRTLLVGDGFYEFLYPACVSLFFPADVDVVIYPDGTLSSALDSKTKQNRFVGNWLSSVPAGGCPAACSPYETGCTCPAELGMEGSMHVVHAGGFTFQNPPVFMERAKPTARDALFEVEALLDHLTQHPNTPTFIAFRIIQRFVTSNPTADYVTAVSEAFKSGAYAGVTYGTYGDLKATLMAVLLHPEARSQTSSSNGALREPFLKVIHLMRSMEYKDNSARPVFLRNLIDTIGQFPYASPTVFNFYLPEFRPDGFPDGLVAPEFQIYTPPNALAFANGMCSLIDAGLSDCNQGFGVEVSGCSSGSFDFTQAGSTMSEALVELDLLLTGGRLEHKGAVQAAYQRDGWKDAQKLMVLTPEFNTLGHPMRGGVRPPAPPTSTGAASSYKAVVMLFLKGGMDSFQMLVPLDCPLYDEYATVRRSITLLPDEVHRIQATGQACGDFGIHPRLPFLKQLYDQQKVAFINDVGSLVEPLTPDMIGTGFHAQGGSGKRCQGLFSHADQQRAAETLTCQYATAEFKGAGGRMADAVAAGDYNTQSFSLKGQATWPQGFDISGDVLGQSSGTSAFPEYERFQDIIDNMTGTLHGNVYSDQYAKTLRQSISFNLGLEKQLANAKLETSYEINGYQPLHSQLKQAATLISARVDRQAERDFFFVEDGGWDAHSGVQESLYKKFGQVNSALEQFVTELEAQGMFDDVVIVTHTDFARTLTPNSNAGTDHGWSGINMILSGAVKGGIYNDYPRMAEGSEMDAGRGRLIPRYPLEGMMMPVAEWMGMQPAQANQVFPNLGNFNSSHILTKETLFGP